MTPSPSPTSRPPSKRPSSSSPAAAGGSGVLPWIIGAVVVVAVGVALVVAARGGGESTSSDQAAGGGGTTTTIDPVEVSGTPLPQTELPSATDPAVGMAMPVVTGQDLSGAPMTVPVAGKPTVVVYVAHWCPHCQREVPVLTEWASANGLPEGVAVQAVATSNDPTRPNYPADAWLEREGWPFPTLYDPDGSAAAAAGLTGFPFFVVVDADGTVVARTSGELSTEAWEQLLAAAVR